MGFQEVPLQGFDSTATNSLNLSRRADRKANVTFGSTTQYPFRPGGMDVEASDMSVAASAAAAHRDLGLDGPLLQVPPGFTNGMPFTDSAVELSELAGVVGDEEAAAASAPRPSDVLSLASVLDLALDSEEEEQEGDGSDAGRRGLQPVATGASTSKEQEEETAQELDTLEQALSSTTAATDSKGAGRAKRAGGTEGGKAITWAHVVDEAVVVHDFAWQVGAARTVHSSARPNDAECTLCAH